MRSSLSRGTALSKRISSIIRVKLVLFRSINRCNVRVLTPVISDRCLMLGKFTCCILLINKWRMADNGWLDKKLSDGCGMLELPFAGFSGIVSDKKGIGIAVIVSSNSIFRLCKNSLSAMSLCLVHWSRILLGRHSSPKPNWNVRSPLTILQRRATTQMLQIHQYILTPEYFGPRKIAVLHLSNQAREFFLRITLS